MRIALLLALVAVLGAPARAEDVIVLKDGHRVTGTIVSLNEEEVRIKVGDGEFILPVSLIAEIKRDEKTGETPPAPEKPPVPRPPAADGPDVIKLRAGGREYEGKILAEDESTITMQVGDQKLGFDKSVIAWVRSGGKTRRFDAPGRAGPGPASPQAAPVVKRWIEVCLKHLASEDRMVQRSAGNALRSLGAAARPALERAAEGEDARLAAAAKRLLESRRGNRSGRNGAGGRGNMTQRLANQLELTEEQKPKFSKVMEEASGRRRALMESMRGGEIPREEIQERMREIQSEALVKLGEILTEDQMARYQEMMRRMRGGGRRGGGR